MSISLPSSDIGKTGLMDHPAVKAWRKLRPERVDPDNVEVLKDKLEPMVYRLAGVGPGGSAVIAKRCDPATAALERTIYEDILPCLPVTAVRFYGALGVNGANGDARPCWLFMEDAGGEKYLPDLDRHRAAAAQWLATLHVSVARLPAAPSLPDRGSGYYLGWVRSLRNRITQSFSNPALEPEHREVLNAILAQCDALESGWSEIERFCDSMPRTLVHGDLTPENVRVRTTPDGMALLVMDWERAGWGLPAIDFTQLKGEVRPDIDHYGSVVRSCWPYLDSPSLHRLARLGNLFRLLFEMNQVSERLQLEWVRRPMKHMLALQAAMADSMREAGWGA